MRRLLTVAAWLIFVVAAAVTIPTLWVADHVADEDGYVAFSGPLGTDAELQKAFAAYLSDYLVQETGLPEAVQPAVSTALAAATSRTTDEPGFDKAWRETQRRSHRMVFGPDRDQDRFAVDLGPLADFVAKQAAGDLPVELQLPDKIVLPVNDAPDPAAIDQVEATPDRGRLGLIVVAVAAIATLVFARRRSTALAALGLGAVLVAGALRLASGYGIPGVLDRAPAPSEFARTLQKLLVDRAADSLAGWLLWVAVGGGVAIAVGLVGRVAGSGQR